MLVDMMKRMRTRKVQVLVMAVVMLMALSTLAFANTSNGNEFNSLYSVVLGWITGLPGMIIAFALAILGAIRAFTGGGVMWFFGGLIVAALIFMLPSIITGLGGATI